jgi:uncharacterized membrane protein (UPF0127 family)
MKPCMWMKNLIRKTKIVRINDFEGILEINNYVFPKKQAICVKSYQQILFFYQQLIVLL